MSGWTRSLLVYCPDCIRIQEPPHEAGSERVNTSAVSCTAVSTCETGLPRPPLPIPRHPTLSRLVRLQTVCRFSTALGGSPSAPCGAGSGAARSAASMRWRQSIPDCGPSCLDGLVRWRVGRYLESSSPSRRRRVVGLSVSPCRPRDRQQQEAVLKGVDFMRNTAIEGKQLPGPQIECPVKCPHAD